MTTASTISTLFGKIAKFPLSKRGRQLNYRFLCPNCLHFGSFDFACGQCWAEIPGYANGENTQTCPRCQGSLLSADGDGVRAYCKQCKGNCDRAIYHRRQVRVLATLRTADSQSLHRAVSGQEYQPQGGKGYVYDDGAQLAVVLNLSTFRDEALPPSHTHALWEIESIWLGLTSSDPKELALEWGEAADCFINQTKLTEGQRQAITVCVRQAEANPVVRAVLETRFGVVRSGVTEAEFLFQRTQTNAVTVRGVAAPPIAALISALKDNDPKERRKSREALGIVSHEFAVPALIASLLDEAARDEAAEALVMIGKPAIPALIAALKDRDPGRRFCAAAALVMIGQPALPALITALGDSGSVASVVINLGEVETLVGIGRPAVPALIAAFKDSAPNVREQAAKALGEIGDPSATRALIAALKDPQWKVREQAVRALGRIGDKSAVPAMIAALKKNGSNGLLAKVLGKIGKTNVHGHFGAPRDFHDPFGAPRDFHDLIGAPRDFHDLFGAFGESEGPAPSDNISFVREAAATALGEIGDASAVPALIDGLQDSDPGVNEAATKALVKIGTPGVPGLIAVLRSKDSGVRYRAADALGEIGDPSAVDALEAADRDYHENNRCHFCDALRRLGDKLTQAYDLFHSQRT
jgi:HEAT repeat protein